MTKLPLLLLISSSIFFAACTSSDVPMTPKSPMYKLGQTDGCTTATGAYTKNSENFRNNKEYEDGWYEGRRNCNPVHNAK